MTDKIYKVVLYGGYVGLIAAVSLEAARKMAMSEQGSSNVQGVALASEEDLAWVKGMGGPIPDIKPKSKLPSEWAKDGYYVIEGKRPKVGDSCDYYDREGRKRQGTIKAIDDESITIDGIRTVIIPETFKIRHGR